MLDRGRLADAGQPTPLLAVDDNITQGAILLPVRGEPFGSAQYRLVEP